MNPRSSQKRRLGLRSLVAFLTLVVFTTACAASPSVTVMSGPQTLTEQAAGTQGTLAAQPFEATPIFLARVQERTAQADSLRFEVFTEFDTSLFAMGSRTEPVMTGEQSGTTSRTALDLSSLMGPLAELGGFDSDALTMTMITDDNVLYLNAPFLAEMLATTGEAGNADLDWVNDLATGWGRLDASEHAGSDLLNNLGFGSGAGGDEILALLNSVSTVMDGGRDEVRGVGVNLAFAEVSVLDILAASGESLADLGMPNNSRDALQDLQANVAVSVDDDGMVRRIEYTLDLGRLLEGDPQAQGMNMVMWQRVDFYDFGVDIGVAPPTTWVDITNEFEDLLDEFN